MLILTIRTDKPEAELGLYDGQKQLHYITWQAHRALAETINHKIVNILMAGGVRLHDLQAIAVFQGPGSFTGLRIGTAVANGLAYALSVPITSGIHDNWKERAIDELLAGRNERTIVPEYGALPNITAPKH